MPRTDNDRLRDGAAALATLATPEPDTLEGLVERLGVVMNGALALQSTDDLGSADANEKAWNDMLRLQKAGDEIREKIKTFKGEN